MVLTNFLDIRVLIFYGLHLLLQECFVISHALVDRDLSDSDCIVANNFALAFDSENSHSLNCDISLIAFPSDWYKPIIALNSVLHYLQYIVYFVRVDSRAPAGANALSPIDQYQR